MKLNGDNDLDNLLKKYHNNYLCGGRTCNIFMNDKDVLKLFWYNICNDKVLKIIKDLKLDNFYEIKDLLYDKNNLFIGYIMKYYENMNIDILTMPVDYTLDNLYFLRKSINILSDNNILAGDLRYDNVILNEDKIIVIDADEYILNNFYSFEKLRDSNLFFLNTLFTSIYTESCKIYHNDIDLNKINYLFNMSDSNNIHKSLKKYKYPIDYLKK